MNRLRRRTRTFHQLLATAIVALVDERRLSQSNADLFEKVKVVRHLHFFLC